MTYSQPPRVGRRRVVFMGTPDFAVPTLERLVATQNVVAVFTQPDRPAGRGRQVRIGPVKRLALAHGIDVHQPASLRGGAGEALARLHPDVVVVVAYGLLLPPDVLAAPSCGCLNVHASLLPRWRGAAPVSHAILAGDSVTGVTIMSLDEGLDTGPVLAARTVGIEPGETAGDLTTRLAHLGADLLDETLPCWLDGAIDPLPQDDRLATYAPRLHPADGRLDWAADAAALVRRVRAMHPWPGAFADLPDGTRLKIHAATALAGDAAPVTGASPGTVVPTGTCPAVVTGDGLLRLDVVQPPGRRAMAGAAFARGRAGFVGTVLAPRAPTDS